MKGLEEQLAADAGDGELLVFPAVGRPPEGVGELPFAAPPDHLVDEVEVLLPIHSECFEALPEERPDLLDLIGLRCKVGLTKGFFDVLLAFACLAKAPE